MPYSQFTIEKVKKDFQLTTVEGIRFFPDSIESVTPSSRLQAILEDLPWALAVDTEKARSEVITNPILLEVRRIFNQQKRN
jgi:putative heme iron utilization protein